LAWSGYDETLRLICTFEMEPPQERMAEIYETLNRTNDMCWAGAFTYWSAQRLMVYRYGLVLAGGQMASPEQIDTMIGTAVMAAERFYPAFQLVAWGDRTPEDAMQVAISEAYGRA
ncbi:MAG: YbjN domain-containing protein, partial [Alphaproteobacteria bacterium]|nr:YbjN domain-containing protein [Alphaproteobacteria bacterium]